MRTLQGWRREVVGAELLELLPGSARCGSAPDGRSRSPTSSEVPFPHAPLVPVLIICALTALVAGCGAADNVKSAVDPVAQAATKTVNSGSVEVAMSGKVSAAGQEIPLKGEGVFDLKAKRGQLTMTTSVPGQGDVAIEEIMDGLVLYMRSDALARGAARRQVVAEARPRGGRRARRASTSRSCSQLSGGGDPTRS